MTTCSECGAPVAEGGSCRDHFHALLLLEAEMPGAPGKLPHFYAVACYGLQHPKSTNYTESALAGMRKAVAEALDGASLEYIRRRTRYEIDGATRATRRPSGGQETKERLIVLLDRAAKLPGANC